MNVNADLVFFTALTAISVVVLFYVGKRALAAWSRWSNVMDAPLIDETDPNLMMLQPSWHLPERRWPSPLPSAGQKMAPQLCRAYARLARSQARSLRAGAEVVLLIAAALLSIQAPGLLAALGGLISNHQAVTLEFLGKVLLWMASVAPVMMAIITGVALRARSESFDIAYSYYREVAEERLHPPTSHPHGKDAPTGNARRARQRLLWWIGNVRRRSFSRTGG